MGNTCGSNGSTLNHGGGGYSNRQGGVKRRQVVSHGSDHDDLSQPRYGTPMGTKKVDNLHRLLTPRIKVDDRDERLPQRLPTIKPVTKMET
ncbi:hypothetical protein V6N13_059978 [Hibiscus sabdariffa]